MDNKELMEFMEDIAKYLYYTNQRQIVYSSFINNEQVTIHFQLTRDNENKSEKL